MFIKNHMDVYWNTNLARSLKVTEHPSEEGTAWVVEMEMAAPIREVAYFAVAGHFEKEAREYLQQLKDALPDWEEDIDGTLWNMSLAYQVEVIPSFNDKRYKFAVQALFHDHPRAVNPKFRPSNTWGEAEKQLEDMLKRVEVWCS